MKKMMLLILNILLLTNSIFAIELPLLDDSIKEIEEQQRTNFYIGLGILIILIFVVIVIWKLIKNFQFYPKLF